MLESEMPESIVSPEEKSGFKTWETFETKMYEVIEEFRTNQYVRTGEVSKIREGRSILYETLYEDLGRGYREKVAVNYRYEFYETDYGFFVSVRDARKPSADATTQRNINTSAFTGVKLNEVFEYIVNFHKNQKDDEQTPFAAIQINPTKRLRKNRKNFSLEELDYKAKKKPRTQRMLLPPTAEEIANCIGNADETPLYVWHPAHPEVNFAERLYDHVYRILVRN